MAGLPRFMQKLFANGGVGPLLNLGIMPNELQRRTSDTGSIVLPNGTTAQRDATAAAGSLRFNSTTGNAEIFDGSNWVQVVTSSDGRSVPLGTCSMHMCRISGGAVVAPEGYLICDGSQVSYADYPDLVSLLWQFTAFAGDGSSYALLPNLHHRFLEGTTSLEEIGTLVEAGLPDITGGGQGWHRELDLSSFGFDSLNGAFTGLSGNRTRGVTTVEANQSACLAWSFGASKCSSLYGNSSTVQPTSIRLMPCIRI